MIDLKRRYTEMVEVTWIDSCAIHGWSEEIDARDMEPETVRTVGHLIRDTEDSIVVAQSISTHRVDTPVCIPKLCITKISNNPRETD